MQKHLIFDFDGVIGDTYETNLRLVQALHPGVLEEQYRIDHHRGNVFAAPAVPFTPVTAGQYYIQYNEHLSVQHIAKAIPSLKILGTQYRLHIVTSNCEVAIRRVLNEAGVEHYFGLVLGQEVHASKAKKFQHLAAVESIALEADALFVTDTLGDLHEAAEVGLPAMAVTFGYHPALLLSEGRPLTLAGSWDEVVHQAQQFLG